MSFQLQDIRKPVEQEMKLFDIHFREAMKSKVPLLDKVTYYIVKTKGKQFRPLVSILCAKVFDLPNEKSYAAATLVELLHTATLVHDDVVDDSFQRRGFFSIKALWKNKIAVLVGDYLLSRGLLIALRRKHFDLLEILSDAVSDMSEGELLQLEKSRKLDITEDIYFDIIRQKTASLIRAAALCGAKSTTNDEQSLKHIAEFGEKLGLAFQIKDDIMDLTPGIIGKPKIHDIKDKKMTLPLICALNHASQSDRSYIIRLIRSDSENEDHIKKVLKFIDEFEGIRWATEKMLALKNEALDLLKILPENEAKKSLTMLCEYVVNRKK
jgi:octaprenyl-diphosphate synthase